MAEQGSKMTEEQKTQTQQLRDELKTALDNNDIETLKSKMSQLEQAAAMAQQYQANQQGNTQGNNTQANSNDDVVDADFTEKK